MQFMDIPADLPRLNGFRYPREVIAYAVWAYHRFALSTADAEDLLAQTRRNAKSANRFSRRLIAQFDEPKIVITPFRDIAAQCTVGQRTNCVAT